MTSDPVATTPSEDDAAPTPDPSRRRWFPLTGTAAVALLVGSVAALVASRPLYDNSFFTHLATGRLLLAGNFPRRNPFLWTGTDFPMPSWWWSGVLAAVDRVAGAAGLRLLAGVLAGLLGALLVRLTHPVGPDRAGGVDIVAAGRVGGDGNRTLLAVVAPPALTLFTLFPFLNTRPQLAGFLLLGVTVLVWREGRSAWLLVPVFATWVNVHGTWLYGVMVLGLLVVAEAVDVRRIGRRALELGLAAVAGTALGGLLYPDRFELLLLPTCQFGNEVDRQATRSYREWEPLHVNEPIGWAFGVLVLIALWGCVRNRRWAMSAVTVLLAFMGISSSRMVPIAAVALVPFAAMGMDGLGTLRPPQGRAAIVATSVGVAVCLAAGALAVGTKGYDLSTYPVAAVDWLAERNLVANSKVHVVTHDYVGNYLELRYGANAHAYVDDRPDARTLLDYRAMRRFEPGWKAAFNRANADVVLWESNKKFPRAVAQLDGWTVAARKGKFTVLCRDTVAAQCLGR